MERLATAQLVDPKTFKNDDYSLDEITDDSEDW